MAELERGNTSVYNSALFGITSVDTTSAHWTRIGSLGENDTEGECGRRDNNPHAIIHQAVQTQQTEGSALVGCPIGLNPGGRLLPGKNMCMIGRRGAEGGLSQVGVVCGVWA